MSSEMLIGVPKRSMEISGVQKRPLMLKKINCGSHELTTTQKKLIATLHWGLLVPQTSSLWGRKG